MTINYDDPETLVAIASAAHKAGNRQLLRSAVRELKTRFGIKLSFDPSHRSEELASV